MASTVRSMTHLPGIEGVLIGQQVYTSKISSLDEA